MLARNPEGVYRDGMAALHKTCANRRKEIQGGSPPLAETYSKGNPFLGAVLRACSPRARCSNFVRIASASCTFRMKASFALLHRSGLMRRLTRQLLHRRSAQSRCVRRPERRSKLRICERVAKDPPSRVGCLHYVLRRVFDAKGRQGPHSRGPRPDVRGTHGRGRSGIHTELWREPTCHGICPV